MGDLGIAELLIILAIVLLVFGPGRIEGLASGLGAALRSFRQNIQEDEAGAAAPEETSLANKP